PRRKLEIIGVARCNDSIPTPTPDIMSVSASTTTYVSAAASATAIDAVVSSARDRGWLGPLDVNDCSVVRHQERIDRCGSRKKFPGKHCLAQLAVGGDPIRDVEGRAGLPQLEQRRNQFTRDLAGDDVQHFVTFTLLLTRYNISRLLEEG